MAAQALRRNGSRAPVPALPPSDRTRLHGRTASIEVRSAVDSGAAADATADLVLARCEGDLQTICDVFGVEGPGELPIRVVLTGLPAATPAFHEGELVHCDIAAGAAADPRHALYSCYLLATQLVEIVAAAQARGWEGTSAHGEALSRTLAASLYPRMHRGFTSGSTWLRGPRRDAVNRRVPGDYDVAAIGCAALFLNYLHHELDLDWRTLVRAGAPTLAVTYLRVTGALDDPFPAFRASLADVPGAADDNPFPRTGARGDDLVPAGAGPAPATAADSRATAVAAVVTAAPADPVPPLAEALAHRRWWTVDAPFRHIRAEDVFVSEVYERIVTTFRERKTRGDLTRSLPGYDASAAAVTSDNAGGFAIFLTREWHDMVAGLLGIDATGDVIATLHHHAPGSASGSLHNDLNPGWFPRRDASRASVGVHDPAISNYRSGTSTTGVETVEQVRAISLLYYLDTPTDVHGGGTGLYRSSRQPVAEPDIVVAPKNNSLLAFECTPFSFHTFISNVGRERNCLAMWLHRDRTDAVALWGAGSIVGW